jgi:Mobilization protein NikA
MKTEQITVLVTPEEKARIDQRAGTLNIPAGELLRRAVATYAPDEHEMDETELMALADELDRVTAATEQKLDQALATLDRMRTTLRQSRADAAP